MVRSMAGQGCFSTRNPPPPGGTVRPRALPRRRSRPETDAWPSPVSDGVAPGSGAIMIIPVSVCHQVSTMGQRLWPMCSRYHIQASGLIGSPTVPSRRRLFMGCLRRPFVAKAHEGADGRGRGVEDVDLVPVDDAPEAVRLREVGRAFVHQAGRAVLQRAINDVAVAGHPADIGRAPVDVLILQIEDHLVVM